MQQSTVVNEQRNADRRKWQLSKETTNWTVNGLLRLNTINLNRNNGDNDVTTWLQYTRYKLYWTGKSYNTRTWDKWSCLNDRKPSCCSTQWFQSRWHVGEMTGGVWSVVTDELERNSLWNSCEQVDGTNERRCEVVDLCAATSFGSVQHSNIHNLLF